MVESISPLINMAEVNESNNPQNRFTLDPAQDPSSPYYIHPSDSQYRLVPTPFSGSGYNDWKRSVIIGL